MELYEAIEKRHTVRDFTEQPVSEETLNRILAAGLKAPSHDHARDWHFVIRRTPSGIAEVLRNVAHGADDQMNVINHWDTATQSQKDMYYDAIPKQVKMLSQSQCLVLPLFRAGADLMMPKTIASLNSFASIWCVIQNILLAATSENLCCALRIPWLDEESYVLKTIKAPDGYRMPCYLAVGYAAPDAKVIQQPDLLPESRIHENNW